MSLFTVNHEDASEGFGPIQPGQYEIIVMKASEMATPNGSMYINLQLQVRNDIDQPFKNRYLFYTLFRTKATGQYHSGMLNMLAKNLGLPNGKSYNNLEEFTNDLTHRVGIAVVENKPDYQNPSIIKQEVTAIYSTTKNNVQHVIANKDNNNQAAAQPAAQPATQAATQAPAGYTMPQPGNDIPF